MVTDLNNDNENISKNSGDSNSNYDDAYKPSAAKFKAEQEAIKEAQKVQNNYTQQIDDLYIDTSEELEEDERYKPGYKPVEKKPEALLKQVHDVSKSVQSEDNSELEVLEDKETTENIEDKTESIPPLPEDIKEINEPAPQNNIPIEERIAQSIQKEKEKPPPPELEDEETRFFCGVCHLCNPLIITIGWVPFLLYLTKADDYKVQFHAIQSFLFGISAVLLFLILKAIALTLASFCVCLIILVPGILLLAFAFWVYAINTTVLVFRGKDFQIPYVCDIADWLYEFIHR